MNLDENPSSWFTPPSGIPPADTPSPETTEENPSSWFSPTPSTGDDVVDYTAVNQLRQSSTQELVDRFNNADELVGFYVQNEKSIEGDQDAKDKILEAFEAKWREGSSTASKVGGFLSGATSTVWNMIKATPAAMMDVGGMLANPAQITGSLISNTGPTARVAAAGELDAAQIGKLVSDFLTLDPETSANIWQKELAKVSPEARPAFEATVKERIREVWNTELTRRAEWQKQLTKTQQGQGALREGTALEGAAPMSESDTERAGAISEVVGLSNFLGAGPGAKAATTIAKKSALKTAAKGALATGLEKFAATGTKLANLESKAGKFFTPVRALTAEVAAASAGFPGAGVGTKALVSVAPKLTRAAAGAAEKAAKVVRGTVPPGPLLGTAIATAKAAGKGALGGLGFYGDPEALLFTGLQIGSAAGAGTADELVTGLAQQAGTGATFGVGAVAGQQAMKVPDWVKTKSANAYDSFSRAIWLGAPEARGPIESKAYGIVPELDAAHEEAINKLPEPQQNAINAAREVFRQQDRDVYALTPEAFRDLLHQRKEEELGRPLTPDEIDAAHRGADGASGVFYSDFNLPNGKTRGAIFLNTNGGALQHESGHLLLNLLDDQQKAELRSGITEFYTPEQIQTIKSEYEDLLNNGKPPAEHVVLDDAYVVDEMIAENLDALQNAVRIEEFGTPQPLARKLRLFAGSWLEKFGATPAQTAGIKTDLGVTPSAQFARAAETAIRARMEGTQAPVVAEIKPFGRPTAPTPTPAPAPAPTPAPAPATGIPVQPAATPTAPNIRVTPAQQSQLSAPQPAAGEPPLRTQPTLPIENGVATARSSLENDPAATPETKQVFEDIAREIETPSADQAPLEIEYNSAESKTYDADRRERAKERQSVYDAVPNALRKLAQKIFVPYKFGFGKDGKPIVHAWSMDKLLSNVDRIVGMIVSRKLESKLPYATANGKLTNASTQQLMSDIQTYSANQIRGYAGSGERITNIPQNYYGELNPESPEGPAGKISEDKARFINLLLGTDFGPPSITRKSDRPVPANVSAQQLAEVNLRPIEESTRGKTGQTFKTSGFPNRNIAELNPLRAELRKAGVDVDALETVQERLRVDLIESTKRRPDLFLPGFKLDAGRAGFKPATVSAAPSEAEARLAEEGYTFIPDRATATRGVTVKDPEGETIGGIRYSLLSETEATVDMISLMRNHRGKGIGEALYRQMARDLQKLGVTEVTGDVFSKAAAGARNKVLGTESIEGDLNALPEQWSTNPKIEPVVLRSKIDPNAQYKPINRDALKYPILPNKDTWSGTFTGSAWMTPDGELYASRASANHDDMARQLGYSGIEDARDNGAVRMWLDREEKLLSVSVDQFSELPTRLQKELTDIAIEQAYGIRDDRGNVVEDFREEGLRGQFKPATKETFTKKGIDDLPTTSGWAILTAENPRTREDLTKPLPTVENLERQDRLRRALDKAGYDYTDPREGTEGKYGVTEHPFIVYGITPAEAHALGNQFEQDSVAVPDGLLYHTGEIEASKGTITRHKKAPKDYFTKLPDGTKFTLDIDFSERKPYEGLNQAPEERDTSADAVGGQIKLVHFSDGDFKATDPKFFGKGAATATDQKGMPKTYFFEEGSKTGADMNLTVNKNVYTAEVDGSKIYNGNTDPLNWRGKANREKADQMLIDAGFRGLVSNSFGRDTVALFDKQPVKFVGRTDSKGMAKADTTKFSEGGQFKPKVSGSGNLSTTDIMSSDRPFDVLGLKPDGATDIGRKLAERARKEMSKLGIRIDESTRSEKAMLAIANALADELIWSESNLKGSASGRGWYSKEMAETRRIAGEAFPEILESPAALSQFLVLYAVTSNGQTVETNADQAVKLYSKWRNGGKLITDSKFGGTRMKQINGALVQIDELYKTLGAEGAHQFLHAPITVRELKKRGFKVSGEWMDTTVPGSRIFGPKVGGAFFQNLSGNFDPFTMDLWFSRTMNRLNGSYGLPATELVEKNLERVREELRKLGQEDVAGFSDTKLLNWSDATEKKTQSKFSGRAKGSEAPKRTDLELAVGALVNAQEGAIDAPRGPEERQWFRQIFAEVDAELARRGLEPIDNADKQAILWYYEKQLYHHLGGDPADLGASYASATKKALEKLNAPELRQAEIDFESVPVKSRSQ